MTGRQKIPGWRRKTALRRLRKAGIALALLGVQATAPVMIAAAADYPVKPIRFIIPFTPGGGTDPIARLVGARLTEAWGQQVIVDFRPGAGGNIGTAMGARAPGDGYTLVFAETGALIINPHIYPSAGFDPLRDFAAVGRMTSGAWVLVVHPSLPVRSVKELAAFAHGHPGKLSYASGATGTRVAGELLKQALGGDIISVAYKGASPAAVDLIAGDVQIMLSNPAGVLPHIRSGRLRPLAVLDAKRLEILPDVPTIVQAGYPQLDLPSWYGVVVPASTPRDIINRLNAEIVSALRTPDVLSKIVANGQVAAPSTVDEFAAQIKADFETWGQIVKKTGVKGD